MDENVKPDLIRELLTDQPESTQAFADSLAKVFRKMREHELYAAVSCYSGKQMHLLPSDGQNG